MRILILAVALCLCSGYNLMEEEPTALPASPEDAPKLEPALKADLSFQVTVDDERCGVAQPRLSTN